MKFVPFKLCIVLASAALALSSCAKKPRRSPDETMVMGQPAQNVPPPYTPPVDTTFGLGAPGLVDRGGGFDERGQDRNTLQAQTVYFDFDQSAIKASEREKLKI